MLQSATSAPDFSKVKIIGVISDTHNLLRPEALKALRGADLIIHAGDIGEPRILAELEKIAPVVAVRGNVDTGEWCRALPATQTLMIRKTVIFVIHNLKELAAGELPADTRIVISGHSHKPLIAAKDGVLYLNPGSAGKRRFRLPVALARITFDEQPDLRAEIIELPV